MYAIRSYYAKLQENKELNEVITNISRERGMTVMYMGNSSPTTFKSLKAQRDIVDQKLQQYLSTVGSNVILGSEASTVANLKAIREIRESIDEVRPKVDEQKIEFTEVFFDIYGNAQLRILAMLEEIAALQVVV